MEIGSRKYRGSTGFLREANVAPRNADARRNRSQEPTDEESEVSDGDILSVLRSKPHKIDAIAGKLKLPDAKQVEEPLARLIESNAIEIIEKGDETFYKLTDDIGKRALKYLKLSKSRV